MIEEIEEMLAQPNYTGASSSVLDLPTYTLFQTGSNRQKKRSRRTEGKHTFNEHSERLPPKFGNHFCTCCAYPPILKCARMQYFSTFFLSIDNQCKTVKNACGTSMEDREKERVIEELLTEYREKRQLQRPKNEYYSDLLLDHKSDTSIGNGFFANVPDVSYGAYKVVESETEHSSNEEQDQKTPTASILQNMSPKYQDETFKTSPKKLRQSPSLDQESQHFIQSSYFLYKKKKG
ncbi:hypothetical protein RFI_08077 [Reticulomyxa filosa]|uniref:Uncharacterized protein n=1 Tax=Reticulomyxa filosa TaxID=46433 RepID=X6NRZ1_RETFI|nr:hypothetical protein RFI_08077 [Reticulomyxa filosa]|eukprot:ETO29050.1 hypothetical protein RFI_08077 [Reticulomyxa filosa]